ncbi:hypothetical protein CYMTET_37922 [Cymbomonas tetramitiformis]|uniref:Uncharacterized protein n=1 Tax=Cymbomonas tetramitiformis TaxID=36881 RepID=A0AAE0CEH7_9CHLO|nr:hypothetical protein CYMTET_37922 [Cymbomonas tetramitiformis]
MLKDGTPLEAIPTWLGGSHEDPGGNGYPSGVVQTMGAPGIPAVWCNRGNAHPNGVVQTGATSDTGGVNMLTEIKQYQWEVQTKLQTVHPEGEVPGIPIGDPSSCAVPVGVPVSEVLPISEALPVVDATAVVPATDEMGIAAVYCKGRVVTIQKPDEPDDILETDNDGELPEEEMDAAVQEALRGVSRIAERFRHLVDVQARCVD